MNAFLTGPFDYAPSSLQTDAQAALVAVASLLRSQPAEAVRARAASGDQPGLYLLLVDPPEGALAIAGFWLCFGPEYLESGPLGPPEHTPPYVAPLLEAAVEESWWRDIPTWSESRDTWRVRVVMEWLPALAARAALPPPGDVLPPPEAPAASTAPEADRWMQEPSARAEEDEDAAWMSGLDELPRRPRAPVAVAAEEPAPPPKPPEAPTRPALPARRSLITVIEARLGHSPRLHRGSFRLLSGASFGEAPWPEWLVALPAPAPPTEDHSLGPPLGLPGERVAFPLSGWLTRGLTLWPPLPSEVSPGALSDRVIQARWRAQLGQAASLSLTALLAVVGVSVALRGLAEPNPLPRTAPPPPAPQPAFSVCSPEYSRFVEELRCQIRAMVDEGGRPRARAVCGDEGLADVAAPATTSIAADADLQAYYCGLLDRERDDWLGNLSRAAPPANWAHQAATQACFNVLLHSPSFEQTADPSLSRHSKAAVKVGDLSRMLGEGGDAIQPLKDLVADLDARCEERRGSLERVIEGAVLATHVGAASAVDAPAPATTGPDEAETQDQEAQPPPPLGERGRLRALAVNAALQSMASASERLCFRAGVEGAPGEGLRAAELAGLCGPPEQDWATADSDPEGAPGIWGLLGGETDPAQPAVTRYSVARFGLVEGQAPQRQLDSLWSCHLGLSGVTELRRPAAQRVWWDLPLTTPRRYSAQGAGVMTQLALDATLGALSAGADAGVCWQIVAQRLNQYTPVHPLLGELAEDGWPSVEQRLCGQVCASYYQVRALPLTRERQWVTPEADLAECVSTGTPSPFPRATGKWGELDIRDRKNTSASGAADSADADGEARVAAAGTSGGDSLDVLRLVWNGSARRGARQPSRADVCAFNLIAQGYFPQGEDGYVGQGASGQDWAGATVLNGQIAGDRSGLAAQAALQVAEGTGVNWSDSTCGYMAAQCFTSIWLEVTGPSQRNSSGLATYQWRRAWRSKLEKVVGQSQEELARTRPWCYEIQSMLLAEPEPEGEGTVRSDPVGPCRAGVIAVRKNVEAAMSAIASGQVDGLAEGGTP